MGVEDGRRGGIARLQRALAEYVPPALKVAGQLIETEAALLITTGSVSGAGHVASLPGEPPNNNLGTLKGNIETVQESPTRVVVSSNAPYAAALEFGTSRMQARPYMAPALNNKRREAVRTIETAVKRAKAKAGGA